MKSFRIIPCMVFVLAFCITAKNTGAQFIAKAVALPDTICEGQYTQLSLTIQGGTGPFTYLWSPAATLSNPAISNPIATPLVNTLYRLLVTDQLLNTSADSIMVFVETIPLPPSPISGPSVVCADTTCNYSVNQTPGAISYSWTVPPSAEILSGQNTPDIHLKWGNNSGTISVIIGNNCGTSVPSVKTVIVSPIPPSPIEIQGPTHLCQFDTAYFFTDTIPHTARYYWNIPADASILNGAGTPSVRIKWGISAGEISVSGENYCGTGPSLSKTIELDSLPVSAGSVSGPDSVCIGKGSYNYAVTSLRFATSYGWTLPQGAFITSGQHTNRIIVEFGINAASGPITAFGINSCGNGQASIKQVTVKNCSGLDDNDFSSGITIAPNPVSDKLTIHFPGAEDQIRISIFNQLGQLLYRNMLSGTGPGYSYDIDVTNMPHGMAILKLVTARGSCTKKFNIR